jgi:hypothetical protein
MNKPTEAEVIKALECCGDEEGLNWCVDCPYYDKENDLCQEDLHRDALNLINRLKAELFEKTEQLETAKADIKMLTSGKCVYLSDDETTEYCVEGPCPIYKTEAEIKSEAYKEFAERLKTKKHECGCNYRKKPVYAVAEEKIDETYKELVGEDK